MALTNADITSMLKPQFKSGSEKRAWSIGIRTTWVPFYTATNAAGKSSIPADVLGAPERLARNKDGSIKFSKSGRPVMRVHPVLAEKVKICRDNYEADLLGYVGRISSEMPGKYKAEVQLAQRAAVPITAQIDQDVDDFLANIAAEQAALESPTPSENGAHPAPDEVGAPA
jgi:hypothetical protein